MKEAFELFLVKACLAGLGVIALYVVANIAIPTALAQMKCAAPRAGRKGIFLLAVPLTFAGVMIGHGSDKAGVGSPSNAGLGDEPSTSLVEPSTSLVEPSTSLVEPSTSMVASLVRHCEVVGASSRPQSSVALNEPFSRIERWYRRGAEQMENVKWRM